MIQFTSVTKTYKEKIAVDNVSFTIYPGEVFGLLGPNGSGKTTLIRMLLDIIKPDHGTIEITPDLMRNTIQDSIGYLPEERGLYKDDKIIDLLVYFATLKGQTKHSAKQKSLHLLETFNLKHIANNKVKTLSKGMQQKIQFISTIITEPPILILDEPFSGLDPVNSKFLRDYLFSLKTKDQIILLSTHQMDQVETLCNRIALIHNGKLILNDKLETIKQNFTNNSYLIKSPDDLMHQDLLHDETIGNAIEEYVIINPQCVRVILKNGTQSSQLLESLISRGISIEYFERILPHIGEIFVKLVESYGKN